MRRSVSLAVASIALVLASLPLATLTSEGAAPTPGARTDPVATAVKQAARAIRAWVTAHDGQTPDRATGTALVSRYLRHRSGVDGAYVPSVGADHPGFCVYASRWPRGGPGVRQGWVYDSWFGAVSASQLSRAAFAEADGACWAAVHPTFDEKTVAEAEAVRVGRAMSAHWTTSGSFPETVEDGLTTTATRLNPGEQVVGYAVVDGPPPGFELCVTRLSGAWATYRVRQAYGTDVGGLLRSGSEGATCFGPPLPGDDRARRYLPTLAQLKGVSWGYGPTDEGPSEVEVGDTGCPDEDDVVTRAPVATSAQAVAITSARNRAVATVHVFRSAADATAMADSRMRAIACFSAAHYPDVPPPEYVGDGGYVYSSHLSSTAWAVDGGTYISVTFQTVWTPAESFPSPHTILAMIRGRLAS